MPLEQMQAFRSGQPLVALGATVDVEPDGFSMLQSSELKAEHELLGQLLRESERQYDPESAVKNPVYPRLFEGGSLDRTRRYYALLERTFSYDAKLRARPEEFLFSGFFDYGAAASIMKELFLRGIDREAVVVPTLDWFNSYRFNYYAAPLIECVLSWISKNYTLATIPDEWRQRLIALDGQVRDCDYAPSEGIREYLEAMLGDGPWRILAPCEMWTRAVTKQILEAEANTQERLWNLLRHCHGARSARPSAKWLKTGRELVEALEKDAFAGLVLVALEHVDRGRVSPMICLSWENIDEQQRMNEMNATVLRGLLWLCPKSADGQLVRAIGKAAMSFYRKIRGLGPRAVKVGNAAVYALSEFGTKEAVGQLSMLKARVKFGTALKEINKASASASARLGLPVEEIEEMAVPAYGLTDVGLCEEPMGDFTARLTVSTAGAELAWMKADGKLQKGVPTAVKQQFADELKELKADAKDIERMLPAQKERIDNLFLQQKSWPFAVWRERYLDHPLVGVIARRLLWVFTTDGQPVTGIWFEGRLVDVDLQPLAPSTGTTVELWHPIGRELAEVLGWRAWLDAQRVQQPFKQAHREVYLLTDAERHTRTYSNRFAGHVLKQHQFNALCAARGWKNKLRLMVDAEFPPAAKELPRWGLRAEYWIEGAGEEYGRDTNETGTFLYLTTDQVRFYPIAAGQRTAHAGGGGYHPGHQQTSDEPLPLEQVPPLVLSEILRDVDLFVGVSSVGNDPNWADGGPDGRYAEYWQGYSFGDLGATARTRKEVLERLVPRLKIAKQCAITDKFLVVKGALRTYKIHLGSSNILMEPNDQYLCIVPNQAKADDGSLQLPFEGDRTLSIILSKAFLLAADDKIKDSTILSQIKRS
jgi:hypothetical protein